MKLRVRLLNLDAGGKTIAIINDEDAAELGVHPLDRIVLTKGKKKITAIVNVTDRFVRPGEIIVYTEIKDILGLKSRDFVTAILREELDSKKFIRKKIDGNELSAEEIKVIIRDVVERDLNDLELAALVTGLHIHGMTLNESLAMTNAMVGTGRKPNFSGIIVDKHSIGGIPGDKTTMIVIPIVAAAGLTIPKTSSRAITDPAGTADRVEMVAPVELSMKKIKEVVKKTGGCMVWCGSLNLAPADDLLIQIERPLEMDPLLIPSVMSKKKIFGSKYLVIDIPTGPEAKMKTREEAEKLAQSFIALGKHLGIRVDCAITQGNQPLGYAIGPAVEAREALQSLCNPEKAPKDLIDKAATLAGLIFQMVGKGNKKTAMKILLSGQAEKKFREIIAAQGGNPKVKASDIQIEKNAAKAQIKSKEAGRISYISNRVLIQIAKIAGAPKDRYAGIVLEKKIGDSVRKNDTLYTIYSEKKPKLRCAASVAEENNGYIISTKNMLIKEVNGIKRG